METPKYRPLERFWPYADLPEQPTDEELASLDPDLHDALFGPTPRPFSITLVFPPLDAAGLRARARSRARRGRVSRDGQRRGPSLSRALLAGDAERLREVFEIVGRADATEVLIDDRPVPYARELWLPLVWFLIRG